MRERGCVCERERGRAVLHSCPVNLAEQPISAVGTTQLLRETANPVTPPTPHEPLQRLQPTGQPLCRDPVVLERTVLKLH